MCITSTLFYTRFAGILFRTFKQDVFKSSSRDFIAMTCIGKKKSDPKRRGVINKYMEVY